jgi:hypothetical protein
MAQAIDRCTSEWITACDGNGASRYLSINQSEQRLSIWLMLFVLRMLLGLEYSIDLGTTCCRGRGPPFWLCVRV